MRRRSAKAQQQQQQQIRLSQLGRRLHRRYPWPLPWQLSRPLLPLSGGAALIAAGDAPGCTVASGMGLHPGAYEVHCISSIKWLCLLSSLPYPLQACGPRVLCVLPAVWRGVPLRLLPATAGAASERILLCSRLSQAKPDVLAGAVRLILG